MNMLAREIPQELREAMGASDAIDLGWVRNFSFPDGSHRWGYPGWDLLKQHCSAADVAAALNKYNERFNETVKPLAPNRRPVLNPKDWDELEVSIKGQGYPALKDLMHLIAKTLGKKVYYTNVYMSDGAGVFDGIDVYCVTPEGEGTVRSV